MNTDAIATPVQRLKCLSCGELWDEGENTSPLYECGDCGERFTRTNATYGNHQCSCGKFAFKVAEEGCDDCDEECELVDAWECLECSESFETEAAMVEHREEELREAAKPPTQTAYDHLVETLNNLLGP